MLKVYAYAGCSTCRKALNFLRDHDIAFIEIPIREQPPTRAELRKVLEALRKDDPATSARRLFNVSGADYRAAGLGDRLPTMSEADALALLESNGNLVKRPFVIGPGVHLVGFKEDAWRVALGQGARFDDRSQAPGDARGVAEPG